MRWSFKILLLVGPLLLIETLTHAQQPELIVQTNHAGPVTAVAFSPDGKLLATAGNAIKLWDVSSGKQLRALAGHSPMYPLPSMVSSIAFSPDGKYLASGGMDNQIKLWDVASGRELLVICKRDEGLSDRIWRVDRRSNVLDETFFQSDWPEGTRIVDRRIKESDLISTSW